MNGVIFQFHMYAHLAHCIHLSLSSLAKPSHLAINAQANVCVCAVHNILNTHTDKKQTAPKEYIKMFCRVT